MKLRLLVCAAAVASVLSGCALQNIGAPVYDRTGSSGIGTTGAVAMTGETYVVQAGDTLYSIAVRHGCNPTELARANNITDPTQVSIGTVLNITAARTGAVQTLAPQGTAPVTDVTVAGQEDNALTPTDAQSVTIGGDVTTGQPATTVAGAQMPLGNTKLSWPVAKNTILTNFSDEGSKGIEIAGNMGDDVKAAAAGRVIYVDDKVVGYGKLIIIKHGDSEMTVYGHNSEILVQRGQDVKAGDVIAKMGDSDSKTVNLLFEVRVKDKPVDPLQYLPK